jgi:hypothetical protein
MRIIGSVLAVIVAIFVGLVMAIPNSADDSVRANRTIRRQFQQAALSIDSVRDRTGHLPAPENATRLPGWPDPPAAVFLLASDQASICERPALFSDLPKTSYVLGVPRNNWSEDWTDCYEPRTGRTSLSFDPGDYAQFGSVAADEAAGFLFICFLLALSAGLWRVGRRG